MRYVFGSASYAVLDVVKTASTSDASAQGVQITTGGYWQGRTLGDSFMTIRGRVVARTATDVSLAYRRVDLIIPASGTPLIVSPIANVDGVVGYDGIGIIAGGGRVLEYATDIFWEFTGLAATPINWRAHFVIEVSKGPAAP
jgi:hypothetical protein